MKNIIDTKLKELESMGYGEHTTRLQEGITLTYINPSPLDNILKFGRRTSKELGQKELSYVKELEVRKNIENILNQLERDFGRKDSSEEYANLSQGE